MATYKFYRLETTAEGVEVYHPRQATPIFVAEDVADAKRFVNAYRDGRIWAVQAALA